MTIRGEKVGSKTLSNDRLVNSEGALNKSSKPGISESEDGTALESDQKEGGANHLPAGRRTNNEVFLEEDSKPGFPVTTSEKEQTDDSFKGEQSASTPTDKAGNDSYGLTCIECGPHGFSSKICKGGKRDDQTYACYEDDFYDENATGYTDTDCHLMAAAAIDEAVRTKSVDDIKKREDLDEAGKDEAVEAGAKQARERYQWLCQQETKCDVRCECPKSKGIDNGRKMNNRMANKAGTFCKKICPTDSSLNCSTFHINGFMIRERVCTSDGETTQTVFMYLAKKIHGIIINTKTGRLKLTKSYRCTSTFWAI